MVTTVTNNSPQAINTSLFSLQKEIDDLRRQINQLKAKDTASEPETTKRSVSSDVPDTSLDAIKQLIPDTATPENQLADKDFVRSEVNTVDSKINSINSEISSVSSEVSSVNSKINSINGEISSVKSELGGKASVDQVILKGDLYYEDYRFDNPSWNTVGNVYYAGLIKTWTGDIRNKIISAQVVYWTGFRPWAILDHASEGSVTTSLALFSANNAQGACIVRVWYRK